MKNTWQSLSNEEVEKVFETGIEFGLTEDKVSVRSAGKKRKKKNVFLCFLSQFATLYHFLLILIAVLLVCAGSAPEGILVLAALITHCVYACVCTMRFEGAMETATRMTMPELTVLRSGEKKKIFADKAVQGDVIFISAGDRVCFPIKIVEDNGLVIVPENAGNDYEISDKDRNLSAAEPGQRVIFGSGKAVVADSLYCPPAYMKKQTQKKIEDYVYLGTIAAFFFCAVIMLIYSLKGLNPLELILSFVGLFLAVCPLDMLSSLRLCDMESLRKLNKTSTLTKESADVLRDAERIVLKDSDFISERLNLRGIITEYRDFDLNTNYTGDDKAVLKLLQELACLCTAREDEKDDKVERAIVSGAAKNGIYKEILFERYPEKFRIKHAERTTVGVEADGGVRVISAGEVESVMSLSSTILTEGALVPLTDEYKEKMKAKAKEMENSGMYITALAFSDNEKDTNGEKTNLALLGFLGSMLVTESDKTDVIKALGKVELKPLYVTALSKERALMAAMPSGLTKVLTGKSIDDRTDRDLEKILPDIDILAEVNEQQEIRVLELLKKSETSVLYPVKEDTDIKMAEHGSLKIALSSVSDWVQRQCGGTVGFMRQIPEIKRAAVNTHRNKNNILKAFMVSKLGILLFALLSALFTATPLTFLQLLWVSMVVLPVTNWFLHRKDANSHGVSGKILLVDSLLWGVLFGIVMTISYVLNAPMFFMLTLGVLIVGLQAGSGKVFIGGGFLSNKNALFSIGIVFAATVVIQLVPKTAELFVLGNLTVPSVLSLLLGVVLLILGTDALKYIQYLRKEKGRKNGRKQ